MPKDNKKLKKIIFDDTYYSRIIKKHGYNPVDFKKINFNLKNLDMQTLEDKFVCHHDGDIFVDRMKKGYKSIITTGFGLSGKPHLGSISAILKIVALSGTGLKTQVVLGDLDSYNARNQELETVRKRVKQYKKFIERLGYNKNNILRDQYSHTEILHTAFIIAHYLKDEDFIEAEEDIAYIYKDEGIYSNFSFPMKLSLLLMIADFIHLGIVDGYTNIMVMLGIEEHKYVLLAKKVVERIGLKIKISAMYGKMIKGLNGYPKMCKSIEKSSINVSTRREDIFSLLCNNSDSLENVDNNAVFQMMEQTSYYTSGQLKNIRSVCKNNDKEKWLKIVDEYAEMLNKILIKWPKN